jgi:hypothetical protein
LALEARAPPLIHAYCRAEESMSFEIVFDIAGDDPSILNEVERAAPDAEVQHLSGMGGLELIGTIAIPSMALVLQIIAMLQAAASKPSNTTIVHVHIYNDDRSLTLNVGDPAALSEQIEEAVAKLQ